jgi:protein-disulfide isomerase
MPLYLLLGVVAIVGLAVIAYQMKEKPAPTTQPVAVTLSPSELAAVKGISIGREDAPVTIFEFADFQCPGCGQFATFVTPLIKERLVDSGQVRYVYYDFPLSMHPYSFLASRAARCANEQGKFWEYHDKLYHNQSRWAAERTAGGATDQFIAYAGELGLDRGRFEECLRSDRYAEDISRSLKLGETLGVQGTPTLFVNGERLSEIPSFSQLETIVQQKAGSAAPAAAAAPAADSAAR